MHVYILEAISLVVAVVQLHSGHLIYTPEEKVVCFSFFVNINWLWWPNWVGDCVQHLYDSDQYLGKSEVQAKTS